MENKDESLNYLVEILSKIEPELNIEKFTFKGFNYWPLLRFQINYARKYGKSSYQSIFDVQPHLTCRSLIWVLIKNFVLRFYQSKRELYRRSQKHQKKIKSDREKSKAVETEKNKLHHFSKKEVVFFCMNKEHYLKHEGKKFAPLLDNIALSLDADITFQKLTFVSDNDISDWFIPAAEVNHIPYIKFSFINQLREPNDINQLMAAIRILWNSLKVEKLLNKLNYAYQINPEELLHRIDRHFAQSNAIYDVLKKINPSVLFLTSYTGRTSVVLAAHRLGIPVIDVQHGGMHKYNIACTHWSYAPKQGYECLPDKFWCWTPESAFMINSTMPKSHRAIVGGNPAYLTPFSINSSDLNDGLDRIRDLSKKKKIILVALQYGRDKILPEHVIQLYKETHDRWQWLFRLHPVGKYREQDLVEALDENIDGSLIDLATQAPLFSLLTECDVVLTKSSTIARECLIFGLSVIFWSEKGASVHSDLVDRGVAKIALNKSSLNFMLEECSKKANICPRSISEKYLALTKQVLENLIKNSI